MTTSRDEFFKFLRGGRTPTTSCHSINSYSCIIPTFIIHVKLLGYSQVYITRAIPID